jgi:hypothetical protein
MDQPLDGLMALGRIDPGLYWTTSTKSPASPATQLTGADLAWRAH